MQQKRMRDELCMSHSSSSSIENTQDLNRPTKRRNVDNVGSKIVEEIRRVLAERISSWKPTNSDSTLRIFDQSRPFHASVTGCAPKLRSSIMLRTEAQTSDSGPKVDRHEYDADKSNTDQLPDYATLTSSGLPWCRYCGTTMSSAFANGPWEDQSGVRIPRTLCISHWAKIMSKTSTFKIVLPEALPVTPIEPADNNEGTFVTGLLKRLLIRCNKTNKQAPPDIVNEFWKFAYPNGSSWHAQHKKFSQKHRLFNYVASLQRKDVAT